VRCCSFGNDWYPYFMRRLPSGGERAVSGQELFPFLGWRQWFERARMNRATREQEEKRALASERRYFSATYIPSAAKAAAASGAPTARLKPRSFKSDVESDDFFWSDGSTESIFLAISESGFRPRNGRAALRAAVRPADRKTV